MITGKRFLGSFWRARREIGVNLQFCHRWMPQRAVHIADPAFNRLIQLLFFESSRLIMDCIFAPEDRTNSTGPVVGGVHDALRRLRYHWEGHPGQQRGLEMYGCVRDSLVAQD